MESEDRSKDVIDFGLDEQADIRGFKRKHIILRIISHFVSIAVFPILLVRYWKPHWWLQWSHHACSLSEAEKVLVQGISDKQITIQVVVTEKVDRFQMPPKYLYQPRRASSRSVFVEDGTSSPPSETDSLLGSNDDGNDEEQRPNSPSYSGSEDVEYTGYHRYFVYRHMKYAWCNARRKRNENGEVVQSEVSLPPGFERVQALDDQATRVEDIRNMSGLTIQAENWRRSLYGENLISVEIKSYSKLLIQEVLHPFYIFQIFSIILWSLDNYLYYAACIFAISAYSIGVSLYETKRQSKSLHEKVSGDESNNSTVLVLKKVHASTMSQPGSLENLSENDNLTFEEVASKDLVPGDVISIPAAGCVMTCDAVLIRGSCIVNESMLTGESVPVTKSSLPPTNDDPDEIYDPEGHKRHTLFAGTEVIQTRFYGNSHVLAVVARTGFSTAKGELVRSILFPKEMGFKFYKDSIKFIGVLFGIASVGMAYCLYIYVERGSDAETIVLRCLDIITIVVPPALPAAMTVGEVQAQNRLKRQNIFCISPKRINVCGKLKLVCFDKTGTLTEDGLNFYGVMPFKAGGQFAGEVVRNVSEIDEADPLKICLASCHSLTTIDGELIGDPMDISCVPKLIKEGRCALVTSFGVFKYMALYSLIQFISVLILYTMYSNLGDTQFLYIDLVITTTVAVFMGWTGPYPDLVKKRPPGSLLSGSTMFSIAFQIVASLCFQVGSYAYLTSRPWFESNPPNSEADDEAVIVCWETTTIFSVSSFQYLILAFVFSRGPPYRKPVISNRYFTSAIFVLSAFTAFLTVYPTKPLADFFQLEFDKQDLHLKYRLTLIVIVAMNMLVSTVSERFSLKSRWVKKLSHFVTRKKMPKNKFKLIQRELDEIADVWPQIRRVSANNLKEQLNLENELEGRPSTFEEGS